MFELYDTLNQCRPSTQKEQVFMGNNFVLEYILFDIN